MSDETKETSHEAPSAAPASEERAEKQGGGRSEHRSDPRPEFDHAKAWSEMFKGIADLPEKLLDALEEKASSRKKEEKEPEEKVVQQEKPADETPEAPTPGKKQHSNAAGGRKPWGHRWLGQ